MSPGSRCWSARERDGHAEEVEDQLFRFGRVLDSESRLSRLLSDHTVPVETRLGLLNKVLEAAAG